MYRPITLYRCVREQKYVEVLDKANKNKKSFELFLCSLEKDTFHRIRKDCEDTSFETRLTCTGKAIVAVSCKPLIIIDHLLFYKCYFVGIGFNM